MTVRPLEGVRVVEVAMWGFVTSAGAVLADWGADVLKIEHAEKGDPQRGLLRTGSFVVEGDVNMNFEHPNRGKRSIGLDMGVPSGRRVLEDLVGQADVFLTSLLPAARAKYAIDVDDIRALNPRIVYARGSALGTRGHEADRGGYDMTAFWCRAATAASITPPDVEGMIGPPAPAYGDTISGTNLAGGIAAALFARERGGEPSVVDVSLLGSGLWSMGMAIDSSLQQAKPWTAPPTGSHAGMNPLVGVYRTADDRYLSLVMLQPMRYWAEVCQAIGRPELADDERFATYEALDANQAEAVAVLREVIGAQPLAHWTERFATQTGPWAPVQDTLQAGADAQIRDNGFIATVQADDGTDYELVASPVQFDEQPPVLRRAPHFAEHTDDVLASRGRHDEAGRPRKRDGAVT
jgi:crotonobetainyl-CoA:carnitine CoA-transferase CaiB-like acyl-CoA transferase